MFKILEPYNKYKKMKQKIITLVILFVSVYTFAQNNDTIPKTDTIIADTIQNKVNFILSVNIGISFPNGNFINSNEIIPASVGNDINFESILLFNQKNIGIGLKLGILKNTTDIERFSNILLEKDTSFYYLKTGFWSNVYVMPGFFYNIKGKHISLIFSAKAGMTLTKNPYFRYKQQSDIEFYNNSIYSFGFLSNLSSHLQLSLSKKVFFNIYTDYYFGITNVNSQIHNSLTNSTQNNNFQLNISAINLGCGLSYKF